MEPLGQVGAQPRMKQAHLLLFPSSAVWGPFPIILGLSPHFHW